MNPRNITVTVQPCKFLSLLGSSILHQVSSIVLECCAKRLIKLSRSSSIRHQIIAKSGRQSISLLRSSKFWRDFWESAGSMECVLPKAHLILMESAKKIGQLLCGSSTTHSPQQNGYFLRGANKLRVIPNLSVAPCEEPSSYTSTLVQDQATVNDLSNVDVCWCTAL